jgi:hypothetical protein
MSDPTGEGGRRHEYIFEILGHYQIRAILWEQYNSWKIIFPSGSGDDGPNILLNERLPGLPMGVAAAHVLFPDPALPEDFYASLMLTIFQQMKKIKDGTA